ncbi:MAG TPA: molybdate ABC transporter substrate-binding protein [Terriglobales bacterium]|nr:molybdate ABC transporter substrate-binding protein [Terriglobales bacterium]
MKAALLAFLLALASLAPSGALAGDLTVAAAADLSLVLQPIATNFQRQTGNTVRLSFGSSGDFFNQIQNSAPYDVFLSADLGYPEKLVNLGFADSGSLHTYAVGRLVLWVPRDSRLDLERQGMQALLDPSVHKIAIANPQHAPYGHAAVAALRHFGLYDKLAGRLVLGENIGQAAQFAESGNAQVGIIALAHALAPSVRPLGRYWIVPTDSYPALQQGVVIVSHSKNKTVAAQFLKYLAGPESQAIFRQYGFVTPKETR